MPHFCRSFVDYTSRRAVSGLSTQYCQSRLSFCAVPTRRPPIHLTSSRFASTNTPIVPTKITFYSSKRYDIDSFDQFKNDSLQFNYLESRLSVSTSALAEGSDAVCIFVNDQADAEALTKLREKGITLLALRAAGADNVDVKKANELGITVVRVPQYSPDAVAEFAVGMMLTVIRKYHKAYNRVRETNFSLEGLLGTNLKERTVGVIGTGAIGFRVANILAHGFGCKVIAYDPQINNTLQKDNKVTYVTLKKLLAESDIITLHSPLLPATRHMINDETIGSMKSDVVLVNTSRGGLVDTKALINGLKSRKIGAVGMDVYENEMAYFFEDRSGGVIQDDVLSQLLSFPNVLITGHQAFLTREALLAIAQTTLDNIKSVIAGQGCANTVEGK